MSKVDKKFRIGIDIMLGTSAVAAVAIPSITYAIINSKTNTKNPVPPLLQFDNNELENCSKSIIQKFINQNKYTSTEFSDHLMKKFNGIASARITNIKPLNAPEINDGVYLKLVSKPECKFEFKDPVQVDKQKYFISENQKYLWIWLYNQDDTKPLRFYNSYDIKNTEKAQNELNKKINEIYSRYTIDEFRNNIDSIIETFFSKLIMNNSSFNKKIVQSVYVNGKDVDIKFFGDYKKYKVENSRNVQFNEKNSILKIKNLNFHTSNIVTIKSNLTNEIQNLINHTNNRYTLKDFKNNIPNIKQLIIKNTSGLSDSLIENIYVNNKEELELILKTNENEKYILQGDKNNIRLEPFKENNVIKTKLIISGLQYYVDWGLSSESLTKLWNDVNKYCADNHVVVAPAHPQYDTYEKQHKNNIFNIIKNVRTNDGEKLGDYIGDANTNITRKYASLLIKIDKNRLKNRIEKVNNFNLEEGYIIQKQEAYTIELNHLALSSPNEYFLFEKEGYIGVDIDNSRVEKIITELASISEELLIPYGTIQIDYAFLGNNNINNIKAIIIPDTLTRMSGIRSNDSTKNIEYFKASKKMIGGSTLSFENYFNLRKVDLYDGNWWFDERGFRNTKIENIVLPKTEKEIRISMFESTPIKSLTTWAKTFFDYGIRYTDIERINILSPEISCSKRAFTKSDHDIWPPKAHFYVINNNVKDEILYCNAFNRHHADKIHVVPNLEEELGLK